MNPNEIDGYSLELIRSETRYLIFKMRPDLSLVQLERIITGALAGLTTRLVERIARMANDFTTILDTIVNQPDIELAAVTQMLGAQHRAAQAVEADRLHAAVLPEARVHHVRRCEQVPGGQHGTDERRQPDGPGMARRDSGARSRHGRRGILRAG